MFNVLLESRAKKERTAGGTAFSFFVHGVVIAGVVLTGQNVQAAIEEARAEKVTMVEVKEKPPEEKPPPPPDLAPPPPKGFQILTAPLEIPDVLPDIDLSKKMTDENDFSGRGAKGGTASGIVGGVPKKINTEQTYYEFQVEKVAAQVAGTGIPDYPETLRNGGVEGEVLATFVIDTTGRADRSTFKALKSSHALFTDAVLRALPNMRFYPAEVGGHKVRQLVQLPFQFTIK